MTQRIIITAEIDLDMDTLPTKQYDSLYAHSYTAIRSALESSGLDFTSFRVNVHRTESLPLTTH